MDGAVLTTKAGEIQDAIFALLLTAGASLEPGAVELGWPPGGRHKRQIWIDEEFTVVPVYRVSTARKRDETVEINVRCTVEVTGTKYKPVRDELLALTAIVEGVVTADPTLGGLVRMAQVTRIKGDAAFMDERRRFAGATVTISADLVVTPPVPDPG